MEDQLNNFPREVVISPGFGAGMLTWWDGEAPNETLYDFIESDVLINAAKNKLSWHDTCLDMVRAGYEDFPKCYPGGWDQATVITVDGPYIVQEEDGFESVLVRDAVEWRK